MADDLTNSLLVKIEATTAQLRQEMQRGERSVSSATQNMNNSLSKLDQGFEDTNKGAAALSDGVKASMLGIGAAVAGGITGLLALTQQAANNADEIERLAGISGAGVVEFQRYAAGAKTAGFEMDQLGDIYKDVNDKLGEYLREGGGELQTFFEEVAPLVGVTADQFKKLSGPEALQLYYNSLVKANLGHKEITTYMEEIASDAALLVPLLRNNGAGFTEAADKAQRMGAILSEMDIKRLVEMKSSITDLHTAFDGATNQLTLGALPAMQSITDILNDWSDSGAIKTFGEAISFLVENLDVATALLGGAGATALVYYSKSVLDSVAALGQKIVATGQSKLADTEAAQQAKLKAAAEAAAASQTKLKALADAEATRQSGLKALADADGARQSAVKGLADANAARHTALSAAADTQAAQQAKIKALADADAARQSALKGLADAEAARQSGLKILADAEGARQTALGATADTQAAQQTRIKATADAEAARQAQAKALSDRTATAAELERIRSTHAALVAEKALEVQRLKAQITDTGRQQTLNRMAELRLAETAILKQLSAAEVAHATAVRATTAATNQAAASGMAKLRLAEIAIIKEQTAAETARAAAVNASNTATRTATTVGTGLLGVLGGPLGLAALAIGVGTAFLLMRDDAVESFEDTQQAIAKARAELKGLSGDQIKAAQVEWAKKQTEATTQLEQQWKNLRKLMAEPLQQQAFIDADGIIQNDPTEQLAQIDAELKRIQASGEDLHPTLERLAAQMGVPKATLESWIAQAKNISDAKQVMEGAVGLVNQYTTALNQNTVATNANNDAHKGMTADGLLYLKTLEDQLEKLEDNGDATKEAARWLEDHKNASKEDRDAIEAAAKAIEKQKKKNEEATKAESASTSATKKSTDQLKEFVTQSNQASEASQRRATALFNDQDAVSALTRQEQIEQQVLKLGEGARAKVTAAVNAHQDALERLDLGQQYEALRLETEQLQREALATLHGTEALQAYNAEKQLSQLLAGKNAAALGMEQAELEKIIQGNLEAKRVLEQVSQVDSLMDSLYPQQARMREYTEQQEILNQAMQRAPEYAYLYQDALSKLTRQYYENNQASDQWAQLTEGALDRVNSGFADLWKSVFTGFENFSSNLKEALLQMLAELAHAATTQKIVLQLGASLGLSSVGGISTAQAAQGNSNLTGAAMNAYSLYQSGAGEGGVLSSVWDGLKTGGISGGWSALTNTGSGVLGGLDQLAGQLYGTVFNGTGMTYAPLSYQSSLAGSNVLSNLSGIASALTGALYGYQRGGLLGAGVTGAASWGGGALGGMAGTALGTYIGGALGSALPGIGTAIGAALGSWLGGSLFGGSGERFKETYTSASGYYADGSYNATGTPRQLVGKRMFGDDYDRYLNSVNEQFIGTLGNLTDLLGNGESVQSDIYARLRRTSGRIDADLWANLPGMDEASWTNSHWFRGYGGDAKDIGGQLEKFANDVLGEWLAEAITQTEALPEYFRAQFEDLAEDADTTAEDVQNRISEILGRFNGVNDALTRVGLTALEASDAGLQAGDALVALSGSLEALQSNVSGYYDQFYSEQEKIANILAEVPETFSALEIDLPSIRADYRAMVEDIDVTTEAGQELFATLMALASNADSYYDILEQRATDLLSLESNYYSLFTDQTQQQADSLAALQGGFSALGLSLPGTRQGFRDLVAGMDTSTEAGRALYESLLGLASSSAAYYTQLDEAQAVLDQLRTEAQALSLERTGTAFAALQQAVEAEQSALETAYQAQTDALSEQVNSVSESISSLSSFSSELSGALDTLNNSSERTTELLRVQAKASLESALAQIQAGALLSDLDQAALSEALELVSQLDTADYASAEDFAREQGRTANLIAQLQGLTDEQLSTEQQALEALNQQISQAEQAYNAQTAALEAQLEQGQAQLDALNGIDNSILSVTEAINALNASVTAALSGLGIDSSTNTTANNSALVSSVYRSLLGREADASGLEFWTGALNGGVIDYPRLTDSILEAALANGENVAQSAISQLYRSVLGRSVDAGGLSFWSAQLNDGLSYNTVARQLAESALSNPDESSTTQSLAQRYLSSIPAFAEGGYHSGGLRLVGERGPELEVTGPARIFNAQDTARLLGNLGNLGNELPSGPTLWLPELPEPAQGSSEYMLAEQAREIRGLRADIADLKDALHSIAKHTMKTAKRTEYLERWDTDGLPAERS